MNETPAAQGEPKILGQIASTEEMRICPDCNGEGFTWVHTQNVHERQTCLACEGKGEIREIPKQGSCSENDINWYRDKIAEIKRSHDELKECLYIAIGYLSQDNCNCKEAHYSRIVRALKKGR